MQHRGHCINKGLVIRNQGLVIVLDWLRNFEALVIGDTFFLKTETDD